MHFDDEDIEGVLHGGHNLLAIALHILRKALGEDSEKVLNGLKRWESVPDLWKSNRDAFEAVKSRLDFLTALEVIYPQGSASGRDHFEAAVLDVARARNNSAELTEETKANKAGFTTPSGIQLIQNLCINQIEWKTKDGGRIKVRELVALSWIPLSRIEEKIRTLLTFPNAGEPWLWAESVFMARAGEQGLPVSKPWGDSNSFDYVVGGPGRVVAVQVKSTIGKLESGEGYICSTGSSHKAYRAGRLIFGGLMWFWKMRGTSFRRRRFGAEVRFFVHAGEGSEVRRVPGGVASFAGGLGNL